MAPPAVVRPRPSPRWRRRIKRFTLGLLAFVVVAIATVLIVLHTSWGREQIRAQIETILRDEFPGGAKVGSVSGSVLGTLEVGGIEINGMDGKPMVTVAKLQVEVALLPLLRKTARVEHLLVEDVVVDIRPQPPEPEDPPGEPTSWSVEFPEVRVRNARLAITGDREPVHLDGVGVYATATIPAGRPIEAAVGLVGRWRERDVPFGLTATARVADGAVTVPSLFAYAGHVTVAGSGLAVNPDAPAGRVTVLATPAAIAQLAPGVELPADLAVSIAVRSAAPLTHIDLGGSFGDAQLQAWLTGDLHARTGSGVVFADVKALGPLTRDAVAGTTGVSLAVVGDATTLRGMIATDTRVIGAPRASSLIAIDATRPASSTIGDLRARLAILAAGDGGLATGIALEVVRTGETVTLERAHAIATVADPRAASAGRVLASGTLQLDATASGTLAPAIALDVSGTTRGARLRYEAAAIAALDGRFTGKLVGNRPVGRASIEVRGIANAGAPFGSAVVHAVGHADRTISVVVQARPRPATSIDLDAVVTPGETIAIELGKHHVVLPDGRALDGAGGRVEIARGTVTATAIKTTHQGGKVELGGSFGLATGDLAAAVEVTRMPVAVIDPTVQGHASGKLEVARRAGRWSGSGTVAARGVVIDDRLTIDGDTRLSLVGRRVSLGVHTSLESTRAPGQGANPITLTLGSVHGAADIALEVDGPRDITDPAGWFALTRKDLRAASITLRSIELAPFGGTGSVDGTIILSPTDTHGSIEVRGVQTPGGPVTADVLLDNVDGEIGAFAKASLEGVGVAEVDGRIALPVRLFDPVAWKLLGRGAVRSVTAKIDNVNVDPELLARFGIVAPYRGRADLGLAIGEGIQSARLTIDADGLRGGAILAPLDLHAIAEMTDDETTAVLDVYATGRTKRVASDETGKLVHVSGKIPVTFERWLEGGYPAARNAALEGKLEFPKTQVAALLAIVGRKDVVAGTIDGGITLGGTLGVPTAKGTITARGVTVPPLITGKIPPVLDKLEIAATWGGVAGSLDITGAQSDGGRLHLAASGRPDMLAAANGSIEISGFEIAPIAAFLPGGLVAMSGKVGAAITVRGLDPATSKLRGTLTLDTGRIPLSPLIGTLRETTAKLDLDGRRMTLSAKGKLGGCIDNAKKICRTVALEAKGDPDAIDATMKLDRVQLVNAVQPVITATVTAKLKRGPTRWTGDVRVSKASVEIPTQPGTELLAASLPTDMIFVDGVTPIVAGPRPPPEKPWLIANVVIDSTRVDAAELRGNAGGRLEISIGGNSIGMIGAVETEQGIADVQGHRYQVDHGRVIFDGTTDAQLDIRLVHDFSTITLYADVGGRISNPVISLSSDPSTYTEGQLFGFFLGGTPGGDPNSETRDAAAGAGSSLLSQRISRTVNKISPIKIDVFNCSVGTSRSSAACTVGKWINDKLFIAVKQHLEALPNENSNEGHIEYYLRKDILIEGNVGDRNYHGVDLLWRHRW